MKLATYVRKLKDRSGDFVLPATRSTGVYLNDNQTLQTWIDNMEDERVDLLTVYPVGAIFQSTGSSSPASLFGGDWEKLENTFLYGSGIKNVGDTGGEETHTLEINEIAEHDHLFVGESHTSTRILMTSNLTSYAVNTTAKKIQGCESSSSNPSWTWSTLSWTDGGTIEKSGESQPHNNMPPYYAVNIWRRTA